MSELGGLWKHERPSMHFNWLGLGSATLFLSALWCFGLIWKHRDKCAHQYYCYYVIINCFLTLRYLWTSRWDNKVWETKIITLISLWQNIVYQLSTITHKEMTITQSSPICEYVIIFFSTSVFFMDKRILISFSQLNLF